MIHVCTSDIGYLVLVNECVLLDGGVLCQNVSHRAGNMPSTASSVLG